MAGSSATYDPVRRHGLERSSESDAYEMLKKLSSGSLPKFDPNKRDQILEEYQDYESKRTRRKRKRPEYKIRLPSTPSPRQDESWQAGLERTSDKSFEKMLQFDKTVRFIKNLPKAVAAGLGVLVVAMGVMFVDVATRAIRSLQRTGDQRNSVIIREASPIQEQSREVAPEPSTRRN